MAASIAAMICGGTSLEGVPLYGWKRSDATRRTYRVLAEKSGETRARRTSKMMIPITVRHSKMPRDGAFVAFARGMLFPDVLLDT